MSNPRVLVIPCPAQGHVLPLLEFSQCLAEHGVRVTFVNSDYNHKRILKSMEGKNDLLENMHLVSISDGLEWEDRKDFRKLIEIGFVVMSAKLKELIEEIIEREGEQIACVIADSTMGFAVEVAEKMKLRRAALWPAAATSLALSFSITKLIDEGIIDSNGSPIKKQMIHLAPNTPAMNTSEFFWSCAEDLTIQKLVFEMSVNNAKTMKMADYRLCNSSCELEPAAFSMVPELLPIGPLLASNRLGNTVGYFWPEDSTCLKWLGQQQPKSVLYVAFGSTTVFDKIQFQELALGLELCNKPFLWVVRPDITNDANDAYPEGFQERVVSRGQMIGWAPQQKILSHPSVACFLSHCGWNSTLEGVSNGVPFLCWPYFADQFLDQSYICDVWKTGLKFDRSGSGIIKREEIKNKVDQVLGDESFRTRALQLKEKALSSVREGGSSYKTIQNFLEWLKT